MIRRYERGELIWVAPGSVRYDRQDIDFLLPWLKDLREGAYPAEPENGYVGKNSNHSTKANYEAACLVAAEIDCRLRHTHEDLYLVQDLYCNNLSVEDIAIKIFKPTWEIQKRINSAISYISSGPCPRWLNCVDCKSYLKCQHKKRTGISYKDWTRYKNREHGRKYGRK